MTLDEYLARSGSKSPSDLAQEAGISESTLSRIRRGKQNTTRDVIQKIIVATGGQVTADTLVGVHEIDFTAENHSASASKPEDNTTDATEADSPGPFSVSPSTCSTTPAPIAPSPSPRCSTGEAEAA